MNPLVPTPLDTVLTIALVIALAYTLIALVDIVRSRHVRGLRFLEWFALVTFLPIVGPTTWFAWRRRRSGQA